MLSLSNSGQNTETSASYVVKAPKPAMIDLCYSVYFHGRVHLVFLANAVALVGDGTTLIPPENRRQATAGAGPAVGS